MHTTHNTRAVLVAGGGVAVGVAVVLLQVPDKVELNIVWQQSYFACAAKQEQYLILINS